MIFEIGRMCVKLAGRDAGKYCVIVDMLDDTYALIDGETRRRKCNLNHLEPMSKLVDIAKGADSAAIAAVLEKEGLKITESKPKKTPARPVKVHAVKAKKKSKK